MTPIDLVADGVRLNAVECGSGDPLLLLHGWGACVPFWKETIPALAERHRVIAFDWPGFGLSEAAGPFTIDRYVSLLGKVMDALGLRSATIVGHSMGGAIATAFALAHPERVTKLVQVCAPIDGATAFPWYIVLASLPIVRWFVFLFGKIRWIRRVSARLFTSTVPMYDEVIDQAGRIPYAAIVGTIRSMRSTHLPVERLAVPTHAIVSGRDRIVRPAQAELQRATPGITITPFPDCGHCPPVECPSRFVETVATPSAATV
jgi:pimeloyl-ACP methyl ester carboxylesterase